MPQAKAKAKRKGRLSTILLVLILVAGLSLLLYPTFSDWWNQLHSSRAIAGYAETVAQMDPIDTERMWAEAEAYNADLWLDPTRYKPSEEDHARYVQTLDVSGTGIMGYVRIPKIKVALPIYHGTDEAVLQVAVGHIEGSSLPVGGAGTHCVLSGHRGLPSARLFTDLDDMIEGDLFTLDVLDQTLVYEVDQITVVLPQELENLELAEGQDYCTLVTCTPYGVNSHRMLVRGHRIANPPQELVTPQVTGGDAELVQTTRAIWPVAVPVVAVLLLAALLLGRRKRRRKNTSTGNQTSTGEGPQ